MAIVQLTHKRFGNDIQMAVQLLNNEVPLNWSEVSRIFPTLWSDSQRVRMGMCRIDGVDPQDPTVLWLFYSGKNPQYKGVARLVIEMSYMSRICTVDCPALVFVCATADEGTGPVDVEIHTNVDPEVNSLQIVIGGGGSASWGTITGDISNQTDLKNALEAKQDVISDLSSIRSGAEAGATAVQPGALATVATSGSYDDLTDKPVIPPGVVVDQTYDATSVNAQSGVAVAGALATKQDVISDLSTIRSGATAGATAYQLPTTGIPGTDLANGVRSDLNKARSAVQPGDLALVASTGDYDDLLDKPRIPDAQVQSDWNEADSSLPSYIRNKPTIPSGVVVDQTYDPASANAQSGVAVAEALAPVEEVIPSAATSSNQLADKAFVNSSVATNTANYISDNGEPFTSLADLEAYSGPLTNNDYAFVVGTDAAGNTTYTRYKYNAGTDTWAEEYVLNNSSFTATQWDAINSGITSGDVALIASAVQPGDLATVATSGSYNDLLNKPTIPPAPGTLNTDNSSAQTAQSSEALSGSVTLHKISKTGSYADLLNKPTIPTVPTISTDIETDKASNAKTASPKAVADYVEESVIGVSAPVPNDGTIIFTHRNGDTDTVDLNHVHPQYYSKAAESSQPVGGFAPDVVYVLGELSGSVTFALASAVSGNVNHYFWTFETGASAPTVTWPAGITWLDGSAPTPGASKHCEVSILGGVGVYMEA